MVNFLLIWSSFMIPTYIIVRFMTWFDKMKWTRDDRLKTILIGILGGPAMCFLFLLIASIELSDHFYWHKFPYCKNIVRNFLNREVKW